MIVDVGTNAEIVLGNKDRLLAASSPTGPALEGAQISCGQRAAPGAIERIRIDKETLEPRFKIIGCDLWSDEAGFAEAAAATGVTGICGSGIIELLGEMFLSGLLTHEGVIDGALAVAKQRVRPKGDTFSYLIRDGCTPEIAITQEDVRAVQLAKGCALCRGQAADGPHGDRAARPGGLGRRLRQPHRPALRLLLGMVPDCPLERISSAGNAAGTGARIALVNKDARAEIESLVRQAHREGGDRGGAALSGALHRCHGDSARDGSFPELGGEAGAAESHRPSPVAVPSAATGGSRRRQRLARAAGR